MRKSKVRRVLTLIVAAVLLTANICSTSYAAENGYTYLLMPTQIKKIAGTYFIVDCNHNQVIYSDNPGKELRYWNVMTRNVKNPHALTSDGEIYMVADTENNRLLTFRKSYGVFYPIEIIENVGIRPHFVDYDYETGQFYAWSSMTGEMYIYERKDGEKEKEEDKDKEKKEEKEEEEEKEKDKEKDKEKEKDTNKELVLVQIRAIPELSGCYARSFTILGDVILFPAVERSSIIMADKDTFEIIKEYPVPEAIAGMVQVSIVDGYFFITVSTDRMYNPNTSTVIRAKSLDDLAIGNYESLYGTFGNNGTPYYVSSFEGSYYMIHENAAPNIYRFRAKDGKIFDIKGMF